MSLSASDEFLKAADQGQGTSACGKDLHAHGLVLGEAARGFGAMNAGAEFALRTTRTEHYDEAIAARLQALAAGLVATAAALAERIGQRYFTLAHGADQRL